MNPRKTCVWLFLVAMLAAPALGYEKGLNSGSWTKGAKLNILADPLPAVAPNGITQKVLDDAVAEALSEWNTAQKEFGGLELMTAGATKANADIHISWGQSLAAWGSTSKKDDTDKTNNGFGKETVRMTVEINDSLDQRGITRVLKHELGHAEGLGHSAKSDLMKEDAYSSKAGKAPTAADLNSAAAFTNPTADDKAGKKFLWGTTEKLNKADATGAATPSGGNTKYDYGLRALELAGVDETPITEFSISVPNVIDPSSIFNVVTPAGWEFQFFDGLVGLDVGGKFLDTTDADSPSLLSFFTLSPGNGLLPDQTAQFSFESPLGPADMRSFTNSPSFDSDEFLVPAPVPEPATIVLALLGGLALLAAGRRG